MTHAELMFADFPQEHVSTRRVLQRFPDGQDSWRPHEKSRPLAALATHVADIVNRGTTVLETLSMDIVGRQALAPIVSREGLVAYFDAGVLKFNAALAAATDESLAEPWAIRRGDTTIFAAPRRVMIRTLMMSHLIHHRAQLGVYFRLLGVPVPGVYGPSADE